MVEGIASNIQFGTKATAPKDRTRGGDWVWHPPEVILAESWAGAGSPLPLLPASSLG